MRCRYIIHEGEKILIPECMSTAAHGDIDFCTCKVVTKKKEMKYSKLVTASCKVTCLSCYKENYVNLDPEKSEHDFECQNNKCKSLITVEYSIEFNADITTLT